MKKAVYLYTIISILISIGMLDNAQAEDFQWKGVQACLLVDADFKEWGNWTLNTRTIYFAKLTDFGDGKSFLHLGPKLWLNEYDWIALQVGLAGNRKHERENETIRENAFLYIVKANFAFFDNRLIYYLQAEGYQSSEPEHYAYSSLSYRFADWISAGIQVEEVNSFVQYGPGVSLKQGNFSLKFKYFVGFQDKPGDTVRIVLKYSFKQPRRISWRQ